MNIRSCFTLAALLYSMEILAQLSLIVKDKTTMRPVEKADITYSWFSPKDNKPQQYLNQTDHLGQSQIGEDAMKNNAEVVVRIDGFITYHSSLAAVMNSGYTILLSPSGIHMDELVISAGRFEENMKNVPRLIRVIAAKDIGFANQQTSADLLQNTGEVFVQKSQAGGGSPVLRGFEANKVLIVIDGIRMNNAIYRGGHLQNVLRIDQAQLERTEVLFGPGSVVYGSDALGGVMHFYTRNATRSRGDKTLFNANAFYRYGSVNNESTAHTDFNIGFKKIAFLSSVTLSSFGDLYQGKDRSSAIGNLGKRDSGQSRISGRDVVIANSSPHLQTPSGYKQIDAMQKIHFEPNSSVSHTLNLQYSGSGNVPRYDRLTDINPATGAFSSAEWYYGPEQRTLMAYSLNLNTPAALFFDRARATACWQYIEESRHNRGFGSNTFTRRFEYVNVYSINLDLEKQSRKHEWRYGSELVRNGVSSSAYRENIATGSRTAQSTRYPDGGSSMSTAAVYITHGYEQSPGWFLTQGLRFNYVHLASVFNDKSFFPFLDNSLEQGNAAVNAQLGTTFIPDSSWKVYGNVSTGFRAPNVDDVGKTFESAGGESVVIPNPHIGPELAYTGEIGAVKKISGRLTAEANGYFTWVNNLITLRDARLEGADSVLFGGIMTKVRQMQNADEAYITGASLGFTIQLSPAFSLSNTITYTYGRIKTDSTDYPLDHIPPLFGRTSVNGRFRRIQAELFVLYNGDKPLKHYNLLGEDNQQYAGPAGAKAWYTLNLRSSYTFPLRGRIAMSIQAGIENILDRNYRVFASGISGAGRNIFGSLRVSF